MKKLLLTLLGTIALTSTANAVEPITADFSTWETTTISTTETTATVDGVKYGFLGANINKGYNDAPNYLFIQGKKQKEPKAYVTFTLPFDCSKIVLTTTAGNSTNNKNTVDFYAGETAIEQGKAVNKQNVEFTFSVPSENASAGTVYKIQTATTKYNQQIASIKFYPVTNDPSLEADTKELAFAVGMNGKQTKTVKLLAANLTDVITVSSTSNITTEKASYTVEEASEGIDITFTGNKGSEGESNSTITFSCNGITAEVSVTAYTASASGETETDPLTVSDVLAMNSINGNVFYVKGVIGDKGCKNALNGMVTEADAPSASNLIFKEGEKMIGVGLSIAETKAELNIVDNPQNIGREVIVKGNLENYFGGPGVKQTEFVKYLSEPVSGIEEVGADENAPVEYFNLQGVRVANPSAGIYVRRQGSKVEKVYIK